MCFGERKPVRIRLKTKDFTLTAFAPLSNGGNALSISRLNRNIITKSRPWEKWQGPTCPVAERPSAADGLVAMVGKQGQVP